MKKNIYFVLAAILLLTSCGGKTGEGKANKTETIYQKVIIQQTTEAAPTPAPQPAPPRPDIVLGSSVSLSGILNVDKVRFDLYNDYGSEYSGTFTNYKVNVCWSVSGTLTPRSMSLYTVGENTYWTFTATGDGHGNYSGRARHGSGNSGYNFRVHI